MSGSGVIRRYEFDRPVKNDAKNGSTRHPSGNRYLPHAIKSTFGTGPRNWVSSRDLRTRCLEIGKLMTCKKKNIYIYISRQGARARETEVTPKRGSVIHTPRRFSRANPLRNSAEPPVPSFSPAASCSRNKGQTPRRARRFRSCFDHHQFPPRPQCLHQPLKASTALIFPAGCGEKRARVF